MTLPRTIVLATAGTLLLLVTIMLRAEAARLHYRTSQADSASAITRQQIREADLELQRLRNPKAIRDRALDLLVPPSGSPKADRPPALPKTSKPERRPTRRPRE